MIAPGSRPERLLPLLLLLLGCLFRSGIGVRLHGGADELFESRFVDLFAFAEVDGAAHVSFEAGIEELLGVFEGGSAVEGELYDLFIGFACADAAVMRPNGCSRVRGLDPFPLLLNVGGGFVDELAEVGESFSFPASQVLNSFGDIGGGVGIWIRHIWCQLKDSLFEFGRGSFAFGTAGAAE